jgi:hypothetical protein
VSSSCYAYYLRRICYQPGPSRTGTRRDNLHSLFLTVTLNEAIHSDIFHLHLSEISTPPFSQRSNIVEIFTCTKARPSHLARAYALRGSYSQKVHRNQSSVLSNCRMDDASEETEVSAMVTPNQLCDVCQRVTGTSITLVIWTFDTHNTEQVIQSTPADDTLPFLYTYNRTMLLSKPCLHRRNKAVTCVLFSRTRHHLEVSVLIANCSLRPTRSALCVKSTVRRLYYD